MADGRVKVSIYDQGKELEVIYHGSKFRYVHMKIKDDEMGDWCGYTSRTNIALEAWVDESDITITNTKSTLTYLMRNKIKF